MMISVIGSYAVRCALCAVCLKEAQCTKRKAQSAFTFIEILLVVIIIGALISISLPNLKKTFDSLELNSFSRQLQAFINYLHQRSIIEGEVIYLNIDTQKKEYWAKIKGAQTRLKTYPIPPRIRIETNQQEVLFYPDGQIDKVTIKLISPDNQNIILTTKGVFGGVKLETQG